VCVGTESGNGQGARGSRLAVARGGAPEQD
jgi:hypothetical protein